MGARLRGPTQPRRQRRGFPNGDYEQCLAAARFHRAHGTTTLLASLVSGTQEELCARAELLAQLAEEGEIAGIHMEGPFIAAAKCGAQDPSRIVPGDPDFFRAVIAAARGHLRSITFAPETENVDKLLDVCAEHGIIASLGHTEADYDTTLSVIAKAKELGLTVTGTHLFNGMPSIHHRAPGPVAALLTAAKAGMCPSSSSQMVCILLTAPWTWLTVTAPSPSLMPWRRPAWPTVTMSWVRCLSP